MRGVPVTSNFSGGACPQIPQSPDCKRTRTAPFFLGPTATHYSKEKSVYKKIVHAVANSTQNLTDKGKGFITDGEESLHSTLGEVMWHATGLRSFRHFQQNCCHKLRIQKPNKQKFFIETVFGTSSSEGLLDANLKARMLVAKELTDTKKVKLTGKENPEFWNYLNSFISSEFRSPINRSSL